MIWRLVQNVRSGSQIFSILADEVQDCSNKEEMPIIIRHVDAHSDIQESFIGFVECEEGTIVCSC